jgi:hypothetical protein
MKPYVITTGTIFALLAVAHLLRTIAEWSRLTTDPGFIVEGPGIGVIAAAIACWAWRLLRSKQPRPGEAVDAARN